MKQLNLTDACAIKIVVAERMGFRVDFVDQAKSHLSGTTLSRDDVISIGKEAVKIQTGMQFKGDLLITANNHATDVMKEHDLSFAPPVASTPSVAPVVRRSAHP